MVWYFRLIATFLPPFAFSVLSTVTRTLLTAQPQRCVIFSHILVKPGKPCLCLAHFTPPQKTLLSVFRLHTGSCFKQRGFQKMISGNDEQICRRRIGSSEDNRYLCCVSHNSTASHMTWIWILLLQTGQITAVNKAKDYRDVLFLSTQALSGIRGICSDEALKYSN